LAATHAPRPPRRRFSRFRRLDDSRARFADHRGRPRLVVLDADTTRARTYAATPRAWHAATAAVIA
jgi:hypothetical protein